MNTNDVQTLFDLNHGWPNSLRKSINSNARSPKPKHFRKEYFPQHALFHVRAWHQQKLGIEVERHPTMSK